MRTRLLEQALLVLRGDPDAVVADLDPHHRRVVPDAGIAVAPHSLASEAALRVLREGGNALEAMIAAAAAIAVVYPHMNSIGGDGFWVIGGPSGPLADIDASGASAAEATLEHYAQRGVSGSIPFRGGIAALTVAGTVSGWGAAHALSREWGGALPLSRLLEDALWYAREGIPVTHSQWAATSAKRVELAPIAGFAETFLVDGEAPVAFSRCRQSRLAAKLQRIGGHGSDDFYRGALARQLAAELAAIGSPLTAANLAAHRAKRIPAKVGGGALPRRRPAVVAKRAGQFGAARGVAS